MTSPEIAPAEQKRRMRTMFDSVAPRYDLLNHLLSAGIDRRWREKAITELHLKPGDLVLDLCTGTGDLGFTAADRGARVIGIDLAREMLTRGLAKSGRRPALFVQGDAERIALPSSSVDHACVGFGIRNCASLDAALAETARVLRPGGRFAILEFTTPPNPWVRGLYERYFHSLLPWIGGWVSGNRNAYTYLPDSVRRFPSPETLAQKMTEAGFAGTSWRLLTGGIACLHVGQR